MFKEKLTLREIVEINSVATSLQDLMGFKSNTLIKIAKLKVRTENPVKENNEMKALRIKALSEKDFKPVITKDKEGNEIKDTKGYIAIPLNPEVTFYVSPENYQTLDEEFKKVLDAEYDKVIELPQFNVSDFDVEIVEEIGGVKSKVIKTQASARVFSTLIKLIQDENQ